ncbi:MAG: DEAD/DEAH box helicase [Clostridiales bacterium]|nr:DEAD/DEAH box helicase [Clostridiales bacterium]
MENENTVFNRYCPLVREFIYKMGWEELRPVQTAAAEVLFNTEDNLVLCSNTASGKTEAAFFPIITDIIEHPDNSVQVLYIAPLKSLINDQFYRLDELLEDSGISVCRWHGDVSQSRKTKLLENPQGILQITPESVESLLINRSSDILRIFGGLKYIVIDEIHTLMGVDRGSQVICQLDRIARLIGRQPRRIGLSATIGNVEVACKWLEGNSGRNTVAPVFKDTQTTWNLALEHFYVQDDKNMVDPETQNPSEVKSTIDSGYEYIYDCATQKKSIIFSNSREETEYVCETMHQIASLRNDRDIFYIHHGNLSASIREESEQKLKDDDEFISTCATVTLELGVDIGRLDRIVHLNSPAKVSSFLQRLGRSGRRGSPPEMMMVFREEYPLPDTPIQDLLPWELLRGSSIIDVYIKERFIEPPYIKKLPLSLLFHQTLSILATSGELKPQELASRIFSLSPFEHVDKEDYRELVVDMCKRHFLELESTGSLLIGVEGEKLLKSFKFYAVFKDSNDYSVKCESQEIGTISSPHPIGERFALAGRVWEVTDLDLARKMIFVKQIEGKMEISWPGDYGEVDTKVMENMYKILTTDMDLPYLKPQAQRRLESARILAQNINVKDNMIISVGGMNKVMFPWLGTRSNATLVRILKKYAAKLKIYDVEHNGCFYITFKSDESCDALLSNIRKLIQSITPIDTFELVGDSELLRSDKFDPYIKPSLLKKAFALDKLRGYEIEERFSDNKLFSKAN